MLNVYIVTSFICYILMYAVIKKGEYNHIELNMNNKSPKFNIIKTLLIIFMPIMNIAFSLIFLYFIFLPNDKFIKLLSDK